MNTQTVKSYTNSELGNLTRNTYFNEIPLGQILRIVAQNAGEVVQEDKTKWGGLLCGEDGCASMAVLGFKFQLRVMWHRMPISGRYEVTAFVS
jgi:hypothetical protein